MNLSPTISVLLIASSLQGCDRDESNRADVAELVFPVFAECQPEIEQFRKLLQAGNRTGDITIEKFTVPIESHSSLVGVAHARFAGDPGLRVTPQYYLQSSAASVFQSCMPNHHARLTTEVLGDKMVRQLMPPGVYRSSGKFYAEIEGDGITIFFNDGTYDYVKAHSE